MPLFPCGHCRRLNPTAAVRCMHCGHLFPPPQAAGPGDETRRLEGDWYMAALWRDGRPVPAEAVRRYRLEVRGEQWVVRCDNLSTAFRARFDLAASPWALDLTGGRGEVYRGIYELVGGELRVCRASSPRTPGRRPWTPPRGWSWSGVGRLPRS
jgi:uncharacterized protein (TIGR03067 family)